MNKDNIIFDLSDHDNSYKGVFFAELDVASSSKDFGIPPPPKGYEAGIMGIIWTDKRGCWHGKMRIKFPSGNKQVISCNFEEEFKKKINMNETYVLNYMYKLPMINKVWTPNPSGKGMGIFEIIKKLDMIESIRIRKQPESPKKIGA